MCRYQEETATKISDINYTKAKETVNESATYIRALISAKLFVKFFTSKAHNNLRGIFPNTFGLATLSVYQSWGKQ